MSNRIARCRRRHLLQDGACREAALPAHLFDGDEARVLLLGLQDRLGGAGADLANDLAQGIGRIEMEVMATG